MTFIWLLGVDVSALSYGLLSEGELMEIYDSAAVAIYQPYVVNPNETSYSTSRIMWNR